MTRRRYELTDGEWSIIEPLLPDRPRGVPRVDDRRVLNGLLWQFRTVSSTTCYNQFVRWHKAGVWDRLLAAVSAAFEGEIVMIDSTWAPKKPDNSALIKATAGNSDPPRGLQRCC